MAIISQETFAKFTEEEKREIKRLYNDEEQCYSVFKVWHLLEELFDKENLNQPETDTTALSKEKQVKIIEYCRNRYNELVQYFSLAKSMDDVEDVTNDFAEMCINDVEEINSELSNFSLVYDQIMVYGYVTPYGVVLDKNVSCNSFDEEDTIYEVDIDARTIHQC